MIWRSTYLAILLQLVIQLFTIKLKCIAFYQSINDLSAKETLPYGYFQ